ncbi:Insulinase (Peptidase M16) [Dissophora globulifera]|uniref:Insulinase (Peptidase M16) n=1 Tax=Dissophora globulifera TaxID=979702 RepID=A0A9P6RPF5_9FUNG|nr:Insulinase (Peptidase M16) [Dissophora globulifera]
MPAERTLPSGFELSEDGSHAVFMKPIESSPNDERSYRLLRLKNEMEVLIIHDPKADKSAAAMDVHVGHLTDPDNLQGLAHFLEHLLFLGTAKYPRENEYKEFLALHSGKNNASTSLDNTNYYFEVNYAYLEGALDRFAQFFIAPLFNEDCREREVRAVDSEYKLKLQMDQRRLFHLGKHLSSRGHPYWHFGTGNLQTLEVEPIRDGVDSREELIKFYNKYYSSSIMKLVILGRESLDQLAEWAVEKFSAVENRGITPPAYPSPPLTSKEMLTTVFVKPVKNTRSLEVKFLLPDSKEYYTVKPVEIIAHLLGHEGKGSILSLLKKQGWANALSIDNPSGGIGHEFLKIIVDLTQEGLLHHEDVTVLIFQYIKMIKDEGIQPYIWEETASLASTSFRFKEMKPAFQYVSKTAREMQQGFAPEWTLSGSTMIRSRDNQLVMDYINRLTVDKWRGQVVTQDTSIVPNGAFTETERWYGIEYHIENVPGPLSNRLQSLERHPDLQLPEPNAYIPENFDTHKVETSTPLMHPVLVKHTPLARIWYKKDDVFWIPKVNIYFYLRSPLVGQSPSNYAKVMLFVNLLKNDLAEESYSAELAGLSCSVSSAMDGLIIGIEGYNDKAHLLLQKVVQAIRTFQVDANSFTRIKDRLERTLRNMDFEAPYQQAGYYMQYLNQERMWTYRERLEELLQVTPDDIQKFYPEVLERLHIEGLVHGNMSKAEAIRMGEIVEEGLYPRALVPSELVELRSLIVPRGCHAVNQRNSTDPSNLNSGIEYYVQVDNLSTTTATEQRTSQALIQIMAQIIQEPCFNQLRTIEQLGYVVQSGVRRLGGTSGLKIVVQSERDPIYVENQIENFLRTRIAQLLDNMTEEAYQKQVQSLIQRKLEKPKNLGQESKRYWDQITSGYYDFEEVELDVKEMERATLAMAREFFQQWIQPDAPLAKKLSVHIRSVKLAPPGTEREGDELALKEGTVIIRDADVVQFKAGLELSKAPYPVVDLLRYSKL